MFIKLAIPIMLALSIRFTDNWMIRWFGSYLAPASITWLTYARTLMVVPVSCMAYAVGIASFPFMVELHSKGKIQELNRTLTVTLKGLIIFSYRFRRSLSSSEIRLFTSCSRTRVCLPGISMQLPQR